MADHGPKHQLLKSLGVKTEADITEARGRTAEKRQQARAPKLAQKARGETSTDRVKARTSERQPSKGQRSRLSVERMVTDSGARLGQEARDRGPSPSSGKATKAGRNTPRGPKLDFPSTARNPSANKAPSDALGGKGGLRPEPLKPGRGRATGGTISRNRPSAARQRTDRKAAIAKELRKRQIQKAQFNRATGGGRIGGQGGASGKDKAAPLGPSRRLR